MVPPDEGARARREGRAGARRQAVLLQSAPAIRVVGAAPDPGRQVWVPARWASPGASAGTGEVLAPRGSQAGSVVTVWLTASGQVTSQSSDETVPTLLTGMVGLVVVGLALLVVLRLIQRFLNWRRQEGGLVGHRAALDGSRS